MSEIDEDENGEKRLGKEGDEENTTGSGSDKNDLWRGGGGVSVVVPAPFCNEDIPDAAAGEDTNGHAMLIMEDVCSDKRGNVTRPTLMTIKRGEAGKDGILIVENKGMTANIESSHRHTPSSKVIDDREDIVTVQVEVNDA